MSCALRNIGILAHIDAGKTSLTEALLFLSGSIRCVGSVDQGNTETDWMAIERERGITISAAATHCQWKGTRIVILDTPGHVDFNAEVRRSLRVMDGAVILLCGVAGVQAQTEPVLKACRQAALPMLFFVNKLDRRGASLGRVLADLRSQLDIPVIPLQCPLVLEDKFLGMFDLMRPFFHPASCYEHGGPGSKFVDAPELYPPYIDLRAALWEAAAELDDSLMESFVAGRAPDAERLAAVLSRAASSGQVAVLLGGSAISPDTLPGLLDGILAYLPSPEDSRPPLGVDPRNGSPACRRLSSDESFSALAFKQTNVESLGRLVYLRVFSGRLKSGQRVWDASLGRFVKVLGLYRLRASRTEAVDEALAGDIVAASGLADVQTGHSLCDPGNPIIYEPIEFQEPVMSIVIEPRDSGQGAALAQAATNLVEEDPSLRLGEEAGSGRLRLSGIGELQIEVALDRLSREYGLKGLRIGKPEVNYRETISVAGKGEGLFDREVDYRRHFARVFLKAQPGERGSGISLVINNQEKGKKQGLFAQAALRGARGALESFGGFGYPLADVAVEILSLEIDAKDSSELAFEAAASMAARIALLDAKPIILEPYMRLEVGLPEDALGSVLERIKGRQGRIELIEDAPDGKVVSAYLSMRTLFGLAGELRSDASGRLTLSQRFSHYEPLPLHL